jgi:CarD family transcriptional regulator
MWQRRAPGPDRYANVPRRRDDRRIVNIGLPSDSRQNRPISSSLTHQVEKLAAATVVTRAMVDAAFGATAAQAKPQDADPFRKGDFVVYPAHGVGKVDRIGSEVIAGHRLNLIQVSFAENRMTLRIPAAQARTAGLRKLATPEELTQALATLRSRPRVSRLMWAKRAQEYQAKINSGDLHALAEVVRDLQAAGDGSGSSFSQRNLFELAIDRLAAEFAAVSRTEKAGALDQITQALHHAAGARAEPADRQPAAACA